MQKIKFLLENSFILLFFSGLLFIGACFCSFVMHEEKDTSYMWNISLEDYNSQEGSIEGTQQIEENGLSFSVTLKEEEYSIGTFTIRNNGTLDAKIESIILDVVEETSILEYSITYASGEEIKEGDILSSLEEKEFQIRIAYPKQQEKIYEALSLELHFQIYYTSIM